MKTLTKEEIKRNAGEVLQTLGYNPHSNHLDVINVREAYCMGYVDGREEQAIMAHNEAIDKAIEILRTAVDENDQKARWLYHFMEVRVEDIKALKK